MIFTINHIHHRCKSNYLILYFYEKNICLENNSLKKTILTKKLNHFSMEISHISTSSKYLYLYISLILKSNKENKCTKL